MNVTQEQLKHALEYNPDTGVFTRRITLGGNRAGTATGTTTSRGYGVLRLKGKRYYAHRLAWLYMTGAWPEADIDHIDHDPLNNRFNNLRAVSRTVNQQNQRRYKNNTSGLCGVNWVKHCKKWRAEISVVGAHVYGGLHSDFFDAVCARKSLESKHNFHSNHGVSTDEEV